MLNNSKLQAFLAIAPILLFALIFVGYMVFVFSMITQAENFDGNAEVANETPMELFVGFGFFFVMIMLTALISIFSLIYYILHVTKNPNFETDNSNMRIVWILIILFANGLGGFIYWLAEIKSKNSRPYISN
ncbi:MAG: hypothetical protein GX159_03125 [Flavobacteriaceae bacterium]|jgi:hypothetical protein|nr:hypothetical protein [Flavobacteriaceae bacterium]